MTEVRLDPMTSEEYVAYHGDAVLAYAEAHVSAKSWPADGARQRAVDEYAALLPEGVATPGHHLYTARTGDQEIGMIWFAERAHGAGRIAYLYDIRVDADLRGRGHGEALMRAMEHEVRAAGLEAVRLQVFGNNAVARSLYRKLGYAETNVVMIKDLDRHPWGRASEVR
ncbi:GNAT family N-acetyltransferase [Amycolatopsis tolypomycina]|uniref:Acetyltransferase (GNAT) family protein n=1 Tax=Amycolatopsis tolypomycina TaxID=208445 RepID=A0A1H4Z7Q3_9PSEU|nr:GNAT family N-acetyltransferase [Amycolatopsis tolypomycina]SED26153.1 Acetyltransferase (GNAT) family protein [Amycolatopsis tolypomycina]